MLVIICRILLYGAVSCSFEGKISSDNQEISHLLWKPHMYYYIHKHLPLFPVLNQINPIRILPRFSKT